MPFNPGQNLSFGNYGSNYGANYGGGGGGGGDSLMSGLMGGLGAVNPLVAMGGSLLSGLMSGLFASAAQKKKAKAFKAEQSAYQSKASQLFPELAKETFMYNNPALKNAYQGALAYRLQNMFSDWGMPTDRRKNAGGINDFFASMMPGAGQQVPPPMPMPGPPPQGKGIDIYGGGGGSPMVNMGGWMGGQGMPRYAQGGIVDRPQVAMLGERGPEAIIPLGRYPRQRPMLPNMGMFPRQEIMQPMGGGYLGGGGPMPNPYSIQPMPQFSPMQQMGPWGNQQQPPKPMPQRGANGGWMNNMQNRQMVY